MFFDFVNELIIFIIFRILLKFINICSRVGVVFPNIIIDHMKLSIIIYNYN